MTNKQLRETARMARYAMGPLDDAAIDRTLSNLPEPAKGGAFPKLAVALPAAAVFIVTMIFAMPTIVQAVGGLIDRVFDQRIQVIDEYTDTPYDEKLARLAEADEQLVLVNDIAGAEVDFMGIKLRPTYIQVCPDHKDDNPDLDCWIRLNVECVGKLTYDPYWVELAIQIDDVWYPSDHNVKTEFDGSRNDQFWQEDSLKTGGVTMLEYTFAVKAWDFKNDIDMTLKGSIDGETFEVSWTFDYEQAHAKSVEAAVEKLAYREQLAAENREKLTRIAEGAAQVGLTARVGGTEEFYVSEISYVDSKLYVSMSVTGICVPNLFDAGQAFKMRTYVNGQLFDGLWVDNAEIREGETVYQLDQLSWGDKKPIANGKYSFVAHLPHRDEEPSDQPDHPLGTAPDLPEESLICLGIKYPLDMKRLNWNSWDALDKVACDIVYIAFQYNWKEKTVTLPKDDSERAEWVNLSLGSK